MKMQPINLWKRIKTEAILLIAAAAAFLTMFFVPPSLAYFGYIDYHVIALLFCLMTVIEGFKEMGIFTVIAEKMVRRTANTRSLSLALVMLCFFASMWITNDVALITFVPLSILVLRQTGNNKLLIQVVVLQTIAANLGSVLTPVGNPQNLFLYSYYNLQLDQFLLVTLPVMAISFVLLGAAVLLIKKEPVGVLEKHEACTPSVHAPSNGNTPLDGHVQLNKQKRFLLIIYCVLFLLCLCSVSRLISPYVTLMIVLGVTLIFSRHLLRKVDYSLLLTFVFFFLFVGNLGNIAPIKDWLSGLTNGREFLVSVLASQVISNVPAAVLLAPFTRNFRDVILGTNVGGLGTLIASLASLISYKLYCKADGASPRRYMGVFTAYNVVFILLIGIFVAVVL